MHACSQINVYMCEFRINDKEDQIEQCEEEGETFKAKNHQLKEKVCFFMF